MNFQQILIDRKQSRFFNFFHHIVIILCIFDVKLLLWILIFLHEEPILNVLISLNSVSLSVQMSDHSSQILLQMHIEEVKEQSRYSTRGHKETFDSYKQVIFNNEGDWEEEKDQVDKLEGLCCTQNRPISIE